MSRTTNKLLRLPPSSPPNKKVKDLSIYPTPLAFTLSLFSGLFLTLLYDSLLPSFLRWCPGLFFLFPFTVLLIRFLISVVVLSSTALVLITFNFRTCHDIPSCWFFSTYFPPISEKSLNAGNFKPEMKTDQK